MNGPFIAAVLIAAVFFFLGWWVFIMSREPSRFACYSSFLAWFVPLYYLGAWAAGSGFGTATMFLFFLAFIWCVQLARWAILDWHFDQIRPEGAEEEVVNVQKEYSD